MLWMRRVTDSRKAEVSVDYEDAYLTLVSSLVDAATLEHSLLTTYLYALFSIKEDYANVRGELSPAAFRLQPTTAYPPSTPYTFLDVTLQKLQHFAIVNQLLYELYAAPCLERHTFPHRFEIYPFELELRSLDRYTAATFTWIEAAAAEFDPELGDSPFIGELEQVITKGAKLDNVRAFKNAKGIEHLGSLYAKVLEQLDALRTDRPAFIPESFAWDDWAARIDWVRNQGEIEHYRFFRSLFIGEAFDADETIWEHPRAKEYPSIALSWKTAFASRKRSIDKGVGRDLAWLSNLIYWTLLCLLDLSHRRDDRRSIYVAMEQMASALWWLGLELAQKYGIGLPFDVMHVRYDLGRDDAATRMILARLITEASKCAERIGVDQLPKQLDLGLFERTLAALHPR